MKYVLAILMTFFATAVIAQGSCYTDSYGNTSCSDGSSAYTDDYGNTSYSDGSSSYTDDYGNTSCN